MSARRGRCPRGPDLANNMNNLGGGSCVVRTVIWTWYLTRRLAVANITPRRLFPDTTRRKEKKRPRENFGFRLQVGKKVEANGVDDPSRRGHQGFECYGMTCQTAA